MQSKILIYPSVPYAVKRWRDIMCGIAGAVSFIEDMREDMKIYEKMQRALLRRGPDQHSMTLTREAALIHTRLAVIDIDGGRQPMSFGKYTIVYNGELYNTAELRKELSDEFSFDTHSDTEIVLKSYIKWGKITSTILKWTNHCLIYHFKILQPCLNHSNISIWLT